MSKISPCLWYEREAEEAARFYVSVFPNSRVLSVHPAPEGAARADLSEPAGVGAPVASDNSAESREELR